MINPKKSLGQHFLKDGNTIRKIAAALPADPERDLVIEIGPGTGMLTKNLLERYQNVRAVEIDQRAVAVLKESFPELDVIHGDVLKISWDRLLEGYTLSGSMKPDSAGVHIIGNLPYFITSQILFGILEQRNRLRTATLMMQKEVAERLIARPNTKEYGILSVQVQLMSTPAILFDVPPTVFHPPPKVVSSVVQLTFDQPELACRDSHLKTVVRMAFQQRRKKLSNALKRIGELPEHPDFDFDARAGAWPPGTYEKLTAYLEQLGTLS
ncbi:MAG: 16S rRNA (adenine(1518)-N(6)/adenine(1519)-N(6))-dimethyltransferase RsmA [Balneolaceae bacterium]